MEMGILKQKNQEKAIKNQEKKNIILQQLNYLPNIRGKIVRQTRDAMLTRNEQPNACIQRPKEMDDKLKFHGMDPKSYIKQ